MNERIRELYYECQDESQSTEQCYQRFAELIVQECAELMKKESEEYYNVGDAYCDHKANAFDEAVNLVKKHFGVE